jgi:hypothetical protein
MPRTKTPTEPVKYAEVPQEDGSLVSMAFPKRCWAHVPSDDPQTWYLRMYFEADDETPDGDCLLHSIEAIKRASFSRAQSRLSRKEVPYAKGRLAQAWRKAFPTRDIPDVLTQDAIEPDETSAESEA